MVQLDVTLQDSEIIDVAVTETIIEVELLAAGPQGVAGQGVATGGATGQFLKKQSATDYDAAWGTMTKGDVGLGNVDNTSDANKPVSTATQTALNAKAATTYVDSQDTAEAAARTTGDATTASTAATALASHTSRVDNPHVVTKAQVGLGNADNTSDVSKPVSTAQATAIALKADKTYVDTQDSSEATARTAGDATNATAIATKEPAIAATTTDKYFRGDKSFQTLTQDVVPDGTTNKAYTATEKTKLTGIATAATANSTDAALRDRSTHTGAQAESTVTGLVADLAAKASVGDPINAGLYNLNPSNLNKWRAALARSVNGESSAHVVTYGDSITYGYTGVEGGISTQPNVSLKATPARLKELFRRYYGAAGDGMVWIFTDNTYSDNRFSLAGAPASFHGGPFANAGLTLTSASQGFTFFPTDQGDTFVVYYLTGPSYGNFTVSRQAGAPTTVNAFAAGNGVASFTLAANTSYATDALVVLGTASNTAVIMAVELRAGTTIGTTGVRVSSCATEGRQAALLVGTAADPQGSLATAFDMVAPDLSIINFAANEYATQVTVASYKTAIQTLITRAKLTGDVLLVATPPQSASLTIPLASYTQALYQLADSNNVPLLDMQKRWVDYATSNTLGLYADAQHPTYRGYYDIALAEFNSITSYIGMAPPLFPTALGNLGNANATSVSFGSTTNSSKLNLYGTIYGVGIDASDLVLFANTGAGISFKDTSVGGTSVMRVRVGSIKQINLLADTTLSDTNNLILGTVTGSKIGTATNQKLSFYNSTPIVQPTGDIITALTNLGLIGTPTISEADVTNLVSDLGSKAPLASPTFTGTVTAALMGFGSTANSNKLYLFSTTYGFGIDGSDLVGFIPNSAGVGFHLKTVGYNGSTVMRVMAGGLVGILQATPTAYMDLPASTTANASLRLRAGVAPTAPNAGDVWYDGTNLKASTNAATRTLVTDTETQTLTNKRVTKRTGTTTSSATPTINTDNVDFYSLTAQAIDITSFTTNLTGTPTEAQTLWLAIIGTAARAITWGASFEASSVALPTTTVTTARLDVGFIWNTATSKWRCIASA